MKIRHKLSPRRIKTYIIRAITGLVLISAITAGYLYLNRDTSPIPDTIQRQLAFSPFILPKDATGLTTSSYAYTTAENKVRVFSFEVQLTNGTITVSEYIQPPEFTDIPEYRERFLTNIAKQYATVPTANGTIYLGRLSLQNNKQVGVLLEKGLLVFMNPDKDLDEATWRRLGDQLEIQKVVN